MRKRKVQRMTAIVILFLFEMAVTAIVTVAAGCVLIPMAYAERGEWAIGGEWMLLMFVAVITFNLIHNHLFKELTKGAKGNGGRNKSTRRNVSGSRNSAGVLRNGARSSYTKARQNNLPRGRYERRA